MTAADIVLGEWVWAGLKSTLSGAAMLLAMYLLGIVHGLAPLLVLPVVLLVGLAFAGLGLVMTAIARSYDFFIYYFTLIITPMMFVAGVFYPRNAASRCTLAAWLPLPHGESARHLTWVANRVPLLDVAVLAAYAVAGVYGGVPDQPAADEIAIGLQESNNIQSPPTMATRPAIRARIRPPGISFSASTTSIRTAIHSRFITPPTNSNVISAQQQPMQYGHAAIQSHRAARAGLNPPCRW
jgi:hypothetical protein